MMAEERIARLEALLQRVRRNAAAPRAALEVGALVPSAAQVAAEVLQAEPVAELVEEAPSLELSAEEVVDIDVDEVVEVTEHEMLPVEEDLEAELPPASSRRPKAAAASMDEALASAAEQLEEQREVPLKTPPPESGRQVALPSAEELRHEPPPADLEAGAAEFGAGPAASDYGAGPVAADFGGIETPTAASGVVPTAEQLGQTIDLEEPTSAELELAAPVQPSAPPPSTLEADLPLEQAAVGFDELEPPASAREELLRHRQQESAAAPASGVSVGPEQLARPPVPESPVVEVAYATPPRPQTFLELLDQALSLGAD